MMKTRKKVVLTLVSLVFVSGCSLEKNNIPTLGVSMNEIENSSSKDVIIKEIYPNTLTSLNPSITPSISPLSTDIITIVTPVPITTPTPSSTSTPTPVPNPTSTPEPKVIVRNDIKIDIPITQNNNVLKENEISSPIPKVTPTPIPTPTVTATPVPTPTATATPVPTPTVTLTPVPTPTLTATPVPTPTATPTPTSIVSPKVAPSPLPSLVTSFTPPTNLIMTDFSSSFLQIKWDTIPTAKSYNVYIRDPYKLYTDPSVTKINVISNSIKYDLPKFDRYLIRIKSVDDKGNESVYMSKEIEFPPSYSYEGEVEGLPYPALIESGKMYKIKYSYEPKFEAVAMASYEFDYSEPTDAERYMYYNKDLSGYGNSNRFYGKSTNISSLALGHGIIHNYTSGIEVKDFMIEKGSATITKFRLKLWGIQSK